MSLLERGALIGKTDKLNTLIQEMDKNWICDWSDDTQKKFYIIRHECGLFYIAFDRTTQILGLTYMQEKTAEHILNLFSRS